MIDNFESKLQKCKENMEKYSHLIGNKKMGHFGIYCGRGSIWGNEYTHLRGTTAKFIVESREVAVVMHRDQFIRDIKDGKINIAELKKLAGKKLICYCAPLLCHCSTIAAAADYYANKK
jgi:hypothetical protein